MGYKRVNRKEMQEVEVLDHSEYTCDCCGQLLFKEKRDEKTGRVTKEVPADILRDGVFSVFINDENIPDMFNSCYYCSKCFKENVVKEYLEYIEWNWVPGISKITMQVEPIIHA